MPIMRDSRGRFMSAGAAAAGVRIDANGRARDVRGRFVSMGCRTAFDAKAVRDAAKRGTFESLGEAGRYIRGTARRSIGKSSTPSLPGKPPHTRKGKLKEAVLYSVEREEQSVVIGPSRSVIGGIGHTHEFGGVEPPKKTKRRKANFVLTRGGHGPITKTLRNGKLVVVRLRTDRQVSRAQQVVAELPQSVGGEARNKKRRYPKRPFMGPALEKVKDRLPRMWANSIN